jgi:hypothetical protein
MGRWRRRSARGPCTATALAACAASPPTAARHVRALLGELDPEGDAVAAFALHEATLDDVFLALTGRAAAITTEKEMARA